MDPDIADRWTEVTRKHHRPRLGDHVRIAGRGISGVVVSLAPLTVRDGRGDEHTPHVFAVRPGKDAPANHAPTE